MGLPEQKIELGFNAEDSNFGPFFTLGSETKGVLGGTEFVLGNFVFFDITDRAKSYQIDRGKSRRFSNLPAGAAGVRFNNHDRAFDPTYPDSPFFGQIIPRRQLIITAGTVVQFDGFVDDWNLSYSVNGDSIADAVAKDVTSFFAKQVLTAGTPIVQTTGERINAVLDDPEVDWSSSKRDIDTGTRNTGTQPIEANTNAFNYINKVAETEQGLFFVNKDGEVAFRDATVQVSGATTVTFGQDVGIPYSGIQVVFGSELLYNEVVIANVGGGIATAIDEDSQGTYGIRNLSITNLLGKDDQQSVDLALELVEQYSQPEFRVENLVIDLHALEPADQDRVLGIELGDVCEILFTPNNIGDPIERFGRVISMKHDVNTEVHIVRLGFQEVKEIPFVLSDTKFGILGESTL